MVGYKARKISMFPDSPAQLENVNENRKIPFSKVAKTWITQEYTLTKNGDILCDEDSKVFKGNLNRWEDRHTQYRKEINSP